MGHRPGNRPDPCFYSGCQKLLMIRPWFEPGHDSLTAMDKHFMNKCFYLIKLDKPGSKSGTELVHCLEKPGEGHVHPLSVGDDGLTFSYEAGDGRHHGNAVIHPAGNDIACKRAGAVYYHAILRRLNVGTKCPKTPDYCINSIGFLYL